MSLKKSELCRACYGRPTTTGLRSECEAWHKLEAHFLKEVTMLGISVRKLGPGGSKSVWLLKEVESIFDQVRRRAFELFEQRGGSFDKGMDDWLNAEAEFVFAPPCGLLEGKKNFEIQVAAPGFGSDQLKVSVLPDSIIVSGKAASKKQQKKGTVYFSNLSHKDLLRRFCMPNPIDPDQVHASLRDGILTIVAKKPARVAPHPVAVQPRREANGKTVAA
jgi:HSP20 family protein